MIERNNRNYPNFSSQKLNSRNWVGQKQVPPIKTLRKGIMREYLPIDAEMDRDRFTGINPILF
jgi:hypothetical protein